MAGLGPSELRKGLAVSSDVLLHITEGPDKGRHKIQ